MNAQEQLERVTARMRAAGYDITPAVDLGGTTALLGHISQFRLRWMATRLHLLVYVTTVPSVTVDGLEQLTRLSLEHAVAAKGELRGLQVAVATLALQIGDEVTEGAQRYAQHQIVRKYAAFGWPVALDAGSGAVYRHTGRPAIGAIYTAWMKQQVDAVTTDR